ncbi:hypothetical protein FHR24_003025 [Wenyingzhuangia heitensis]|uniref:FAD dependent oxidoreductase n=1 Tax=Wenyingzhuangia heitensis TaxID=1487859 RepID=A0ABX0UG80_9FLAO|nr:hypothetical protein [Wenyingzhuangia heitensis]NIJ46536.1 hypothetical protein [Wenyingzhuangia heitensis]
MGQAVGNAAALCFHKNIDVRELRRKSSLIFASSTSFGDATSLNNVSSRDVQETKVINHWQLEFLPANVVLEWKYPQSISKIEIKCDTNTRKNILMLHDSRDNLNSLRIQFLRK